MRRRAKLRPRPVERTLDGGVYQRHAMRVPCPERPFGCGQAEGQPCVGATGAELPGPGHPRRLIDADRAFPDDVPTASVEPPAHAPAVAPAPRRLVLVSRMRRDLAPFREACPHGCGTAIVWARSTRRQRVPVDANPAPAADGGPELVRLYTLTVRPDHTVLAVLLTVGQVAGARAVGAHLHHPHRDTCPYREHWSRRAR
ncbi:hypothetical protein AB0425_17840 [Actinosynnema sp. NPDC051121]